MITLISIFVKTSRKICTDTWVKKNQYVPIPIQHNLETFSLGQKQNIECKYMNLSTAQYLSFRYLIIFF
jgi:hypothetical protein